MIKFFRKYWSIKTTIYLCTVAILAVATVAYQNTQDLGDSAKLVSDTYESNVQIEQILSYLKDAETGHRGYLLTKDPLFLEPYFSGRENINNSFAQLKQLTKNSATQQKNLKELNSLIDVKMKGFQSSLEYDKLDGATNDVSIELLQQNKMVMDSIRVKIKSMIQFENNRLNESLKHQQNNLSLTPKFLFLTLIITLILMFFTYARIDANLKRLKQNNERLQVFEESTRQSEVISQHGSWIWDLDQDTLQYSDNLYRMLGERPQSFKPTLANFMSYVHKDDVESLEKQVNDMVAHENVPYLYYRIIKKNGEIRHLKAHGKIFVNNDGLKRILGTTIDITDEIKNVIEIEERNFELKRNNDELLAFNYVASHDLQEPLRKIQTFLSRLGENDKDKFSDSSKLYIDKINDAATRMRLLIDDLLQYSRTNKSDKVLEFADLNKLLGDAKLQMADDIEDNSAIITNDNLPTIKVIPFQIQQLFSNFISNSLKYKHASRNPIIKIEYAKVSVDDIPNVEHNHTNLNESYHKITFTDNGIGFDNVYKEKIFVLFNRLHNKNEYSGTGIGLAICKKIVENHKGFILAEGEPDKRATFVIYIP